jgi:hypothetical protein
MKTVHVLAPGPLDLDAYPFPCATGVVGSSTTEEQLSPLCAGVCPAGRICASPSTMTPIPCPTGGYCPRGSSRSIPCPAGTHSSATGLVSEEQCLGVPGGYWAGTGSSTPTQCGGASFYCPGDNNTTPIVVADGYVSTPVSSPPTLRTGMAPCPVSPSHTKSHAHHLAAPPAALLRVLALFYFLRRRHASFLATPLYFALLLLPSSPVSHATRYGSAWSCLVSHRRGRGARPGS